MPNLGQSVMTGSEKRVTPSTASFSCPNDSICINDLIGPVDVSINNLKLKTYL